MGMIKVHTSKKHTYDSGDTCFACNIKSETSSDLFIFP